MYTLRLLQVLQVVVGQLVSMSIVIGTVCQIMTCFLRIDILKARTWNLYIKYRSVIFLEV